MTSTGVSDEALLDRYRSAESSDREREAAFMALVDRYERRVYAICYRYFGNHADAQDATQDTFLSLARKASQFQGGSKLSTWIYRVATNACHDLARRYARRPQTPVEDITRVAEAEDTAVTAQDVVEGQEAAASIQEALLQLDELSRTLVILCAIEGRTYAEVSGIVDLPVGTIKSRVFRARARLATILEERAEASAAGDPPTPPGRSGRGPRPLADGPVGSRAPPPGPAGVQPTDDG